MIIDGVFSGGGIRGYAYIGAYEVLEEKGFHFERLAGTSAGAIIAALIAAGYASWEVKELMDEADLESFLDTRKTLLPLPMAKWLLLYWRLGLYKGSNLEEWLEKKLAVKGIYTFADLKPGKLKVIASDLTNGRLLVLPDDLEQYGIPKENFPVARALRMSCSIPYFFEPVRLKSLDGTSILVDGGLLSNFPMWLFQNEEEQALRPVLGIKVTSKAAGHTKRSIKNGLHMFEALFSTMKDAHDNRHISRKVEKNVIFIPVEPGVAIDFGADDQKKDALIKAGRERTIQFLKKWTY